MLQPAGDLGFQEESLAAGRVIGMRIEDLLQRHLAVQLGVEGLGSTTMSDIAPGLYAGAKDATGVPVWRKVFSLRFLRLSSPAEPSVVDEIFLEVLSLDLTRI